MKKKTPPNTMSWVGIGMAVIIVGFAIVFIAIVMQSLGASSKDKTTDTTATKFSFVGFIGPFPFGFGNDKQWVMTSLIIAMSLIFLFMWILKRG